MTEGRAVGWATSRPADDGGEGSRVGYREGGGEGARVGDGEGGDDDDGMGGVQSRGGGTRSDATEQGEGARMAARGSGRGQTAGCRRMATAWP